MSLASANLLFKSLNIDMEQYLKKMQSKEKQQNAEKSRKSSFEENNDPNSKNDESLTFAPV